MERLREKSILITGYLEFLLDTYLKDDIIIISPRNPNERGCQLSIQFRNGNVENIYNQLIKKGIICDIRKPDVMRIAPTPLYNSFNDVYIFVDHLKCIVQELQNVLV